MSFDFQNYQICFCSCKNDSYGRTARKWIKSKKYIQDSGNIWSTIVLVLIFKTINQAALLFCMDINKPPKYYKLKNQEKNPQLRHGCRWWFSCLLFMIGFLMFENLILQRKNCQVGKISEFKHLRALTKKMGKK